MSKVFNFCAGPAMLPEAVMQKAQQEFCNWQGQGVSVMEISHRSPEYVEMAKQAELDLRELLAVPDNYKVLFCHGGGRGQFAAVPLNLLGDKLDADYLLTGQWSKLAVIEAKKHARIAETDIMQTTKDGKISVKPCADWKINAGAAYVHYCPNETIEGIEIFETPETGVIPLVADMSSTILSRPIDVSKFALIYAGAQKNIGPSGLSIVIVREDLVGKARKAIPSIFDYEMQANA
ncbi:MAG: 3-phosphoserine/phosphohydroxythreonine transaminase, partial [Psychromonas sp.]